MKIVLPRKVNTIINKLLQSGYEAYAVGGCVRDSILERIPDDWDITTNATPSEVKKLFVRTIDTGIAHGTVTVMLEHEGFEVTTYRIDGEYEDCRHPKNVSFTSNLIEDLKRRDFTVNAMAYNDTHGLIDEFNGLLDLKNRIIRCVGIPEERFTEDALRILRAVRFGAQLNFQIEEKTQQAILKLAPNLAFISAERIQVELVKLLVSDYPMRLQEAYQLGITKVVLPEFDQMMTCEQTNKHHLYSVGEHTLKAISNIEADKVLRLAMLFHDIAKPLTKTTDEEGVDHFYGHPEKGIEVTKQILRRLKFDNETVNRVCQLIQYHDVDIDDNKKAVRKMVNKVSEENFLDLLKVKRADIMAQSHYKRDEKLSNVNAVSKLFKEIIRDKECVSLKTLAVRGQDLIDNGIKPGKQMGLILATLLEEVIEDPKNNNYPHLVSRAIQLNKGF